MDDERRRRMCGAKKRYKDEAAARFAIEYLVEPEPRRGGSELRAYRCEYCDRWHLTSQTTR
ncbi:MAG TPA: hypothetical protein VIR58_20205 [Acidimicrobiales bacterium]